MAASRYGDRASTRYRSGTRRAFRRRQLVLAVLALLLCVVMGGVFYKKTVGSNVTEYAARNGTPTPTEIPVQIEDQSGVSPYGLYLDRYKEGLSEDEIRATWQPALDKFKKTREKYLIYQ